MTARKCVRGFIPRICPRFELDDVARPGPTNLIRWAEKSGSDRSWTVEDFRHLIVQQTPGRAERETRWSGRIPAPCSSRGGPLA